MVVVSIANFILQRLGLNHWDVCSGLKEEIGCIFNDKEVLDIKIYYSIHIKQF